MVAINRGVSKSSLGAAGFRAKLLRMDGDGSGKVRVDEFLLSLRYAGLEPSMNDISLLAQHFPHDQPSTINARALLSRMDALSGM